MKFDVELPSWVNKSALAKRLEISKGTVYRWESGDQLPSLKSQFRLAAVLRKMAEELAHIADEIDPSDELGSAGS